MFCSNCGKEMKPEQAICPNCGTKRKPDTFCSNCGNKVDPNASKCLKCGFAIKKNSSSDLDLGGKINKTYIFKNINLILAVVSVIILFLPIFQLNAYELGYDNILKITGSESFLGMTFTDGTVMSGSFFALLLFAFPILLIVSKYVKELEKFKRPIMLISPIGSIISLFIVKSGISSKIATTISTASGFWLYLIISVALLVVGYFEYKDIPLNKKSLSDIINQNTKA
ncbi:zinc ribbon domain-containing protein [Clostridium psychrophilum]|nr:zinc ribbon domain-containing protein [Clostridium psychrophilum]